MRCQFLEISVMEKYLLSITKEEVAQLEELYAKMEAAAAITHCFGNMTQNFISN